MKKYIKPWGSLLLRYAIGIGIIAWLFRTNQINSDTLSMIDGTTALLALSLCILQLVLSAWRVQLLLAAHQISASLLQCILYNAVGIFYSTLLPGGMSGDAVRAYYFWRCNQRGGVTKSALVGALVTDRLMGILATFFVGLIAVTVSAKAVGISSGFLVLFWLAFITGLAGYVFICTMHKYEWRSATPTRFNVIISRLQRVLAKLDIRDYPSRALWISLLISILIHISSVVVIFLIAIQLGSGLDFGQVMVVAPVGLLANALPITPGGLGIGEKGLEFIFALIGGQNGGNVFMLARIFLFSPAILGAVFACVLIIRNRHYFANTLIHGKSPSEGRAFRI